MPVLARVACMPATTSRSLVVLRLAAAVSAALSLVQALLAFLSLGKVARLIEPHGIIGYVNLLVMVIAAVAAVIWFRKGGSRGLMMHAIGMAVIFLVQIGLGEVELKWPHIIIGIVAVIGSVALAVMAYKKPAAAE